ncbi:hypothetical protein [Parasediminibacterium sp. JCM 36343]|uniref:hypothetical protein n=1 Tax=Parasediminibacterium sp. JCM 36343 TaxID=3374279 RepID=UPI00397AF2C2
MPEFFETEMGFDTLLYGIAQYGIPQREYCAIQFQDGAAIVATVSIILIHRFGKSDKFKAIPFSKDDLSFRIACTPIAKRKGNPNLMPLV